MVLVLGLLQLDAFMKCLVHTPTKRHTVLFSWEEEALKGLVTLGTLVIYVAVSDKRISDAVASSDKRFLDGDKRFSDLISSHSTIRSADKDTLNAIVQKLSTELKTSNDRTSAEVEEIKAEVTKIEALNERTITEVKKMEALNERTIAEVKKIEASNERTIAEVKKMEALNERTIAEVKENQVSNERAIEKIEAAVVNLGELVKQSLQRKGFFGY